MRDTPETDPPGNAEFLTTSEVAAKTGIPAATLRYWRHRGTGPASFSLGPKRVVYRRVNLLRWITEQEQADVVRRQGAA